MSELAFKLAEVESHASFKSEECKSLQAHLSEVQLTFKMKIEEMERLLISKSETVIDLTNKIKLMEINHNQRFKDMEERYGALIEQLYQQIADLENSSQIKIRNLEEMVEALN